MSRLIGTNTFSGAAFESVTPGENSSVIAGATPFEITLNGSGTGTLAVANANLKTTTQPIFKGNPGSQGDIYRDDVSNTTTITFQANAGIGAANKVIQGFYW